MLNRSAVIVMATQQCIRSKPNRYPGTFIDTASIGKAHPFLMRTR